VEIERNKEDFLSYIDTIKEEWDREDLREYTKEKISEVNNLLDSYQEKTLNILNQEFPQLEKIQRILKDYGENIGTIKKEVFQKFKSYNKSNINELKFIKQWEDNFLKKKEQLNLLLSSFIDKVNTNFKQLIDKEKNIFENLAEIYHEKQSSEELPLNFSISDYLAEKLSDNEIKDRIDEIQVKIEDLNTKKTLYDEELEKLKIILTNRIKLREGITKSKIQCAICHKDVNLPQDNLIKCPFCNAIYHYLCVASWLDKYNSCPACQNVFLEPNSYLFDNKRDFP
jgi:hypothetical protein